MNKENPNFSLTRRKFLQAVLGLTLAACSGGGDLPSLKREGEGRESSIPYLPDSVMVDSIMTLRKLPKDDAEIIKEHKGFYVANPLAFDPTEESFKSKDKGRNLEHLWLGFLFKGDQFWLKWTDVREQFINPSTKEEVVPDVLFGSPGEKPDEIKIKGSNMPLKIIVIEQKK